MNQNDLVLKIQESPSFQLAMRLSRLLNLPATAISELTFALNRAAIHYDETGFVPMEKLHELPGPGATP